MYATPARLPLSRTSRGTCQRTIVSENNRVDRIEQSIGPTVFGVGSTVSLRGWPRVCVCVCVCERERERELYIYIYIYIYILIYIHTYISIYLSIYLYIYRVWGAQRVLVDGRDPDGRDAENVCPEMLLYHLPRYTSL